MEKNTTPFQKEFLSQIMSISNDILFYKTEHPASSLYLSYKLQIHEQNYNEFNEMRKNALLKAASLMNQNLFSLHTRKKLIIERIYGLLLKTHQKNLTFQEAKFIADAYLKLKSYTRIADKYILEGLINPVSIRKTNNLESRIKKSDLESILFYYFDLFELLEVIFELISEKPPVNGLGFIQLLFDYHSTLCCASKFLNDPTILMTLFENEKNSKELEYSVDGNMALVNSLLPLLIKKNE